MSAPANEEKKGEYQIKSSGSDGIKITFNKTKGGSKGSKSPKHTGLKPGVNSGPASKKSTQSSKSSSSSQKLLYQKSSSSGSLNSSATTVPSPKSTSQPGKSSSSKERSKEGSVSPFSSFSGNSNDMLKNMLNLASPTPRTDIMKAFDKKFQIPKLSARGKSDDKPTFDEAFNPAPRSAPSTPSPTMDFASSNSAQFQQKFFSNQQQNKFIDQQRQKKLFKSVSTEQLFGETIEKSSDKNRGSSSELPESDFQAFLRAQANIVKSPMEGIPSSSGQDNANVFNDDDLMDLNFIGNEI